MNPKQIADKFDELAERLDKLDQMTQRLDRLERYAMKLRIYGFTEESMMGYRLNTRDLSACQRCIRQQLRESGLAENEANKTT